MTDRESLASQDKIWEFYQGCAAEETFAQARPRLDYLLRQVRRRARTTAPKVLNIGVGNGYFERQARSRGWDIHSLDPDAQTIQRLADEGITAHVGYVEALPLESGQFEFVVASEVLEHLSDDQRRKGLAEIARVLRPAGFFLGTVPYGEDLQQQMVVCPDCGKVFHRWGHQKSFDLEAIRSELDGLFEVRVLRRTAFVSFRNRGLGGKVKSLVRLILARYGQLIAIPSIFWCAEKPARPSSRVSDHLV